MAAAAAPPRTQGAPPIAVELTRRFGERAITPQATRDDVATFWTDREHLRALLEYLKIEARPPLAMLLDLTAIDERLRTHRQGQPPSDFTLVYHLMPFEGGQDVRLKLPLEGSDPSVPTIIDLWPNADWYEREVWDMFGIGFSGHPHLRRILLPPTWHGHPLRKEHPARATEMGRFSLPETQALAEQEALRFKPEDYGLKRESGTTQFMFLNLGPNHPSVH
ncbi:MAG: NADH-quinone oxidoreductase subunit C, partial [Steroidobacteraceae bacterium]